MNYGRIDLQISKRYQEYSTADIERSLNSSIEYLSSQVKEYELKSIESLKKAQEFAIEQDLTNLKDIFCP